MISILDKVKPFRPVPSKVKFEENIRTHLRQMSLHGCQNVVTDFLAGLLTECYE
jgi:hypothetical protein